MRKRMPLGSLLLPPSSLSIPTSPAFPKLLNPVPSLLTGNIPHAHSLIQASRHHQVLRWMKLSAHHIVIMPRQHTTEKKQHREHIQLSFTKLMVRENALTKHFAVLNFILLQEILTSNKQVHVRCELSAHKIHFSFICNCKSLILVLK